MKCSLISENKQNQCVRYSLRIGILNASAELSSSTVSLFAPFLNECKIVFRINKTKEGWGGGGETILNGNCKTAILPIPTTNHLFFVINFFVTNEKCIGNYSVNFG